MEQIESSATQIAKVTKAIGHPVRIKILRLLSSAQSLGLSVKEIHNSLGITQPEASKHLILLKKRSVLICKKKDGRSFYRLNEEYPFIQNIINYLKHN